MRKLFLFLLLSIPSFLPVTLHSFFSIERLQVIPEASGAEPGSFLSFSPEKENPPEKSSSSATCSVKGRFVNQDGFPLDFTAPWETKLFLRGDWKTTSHVNMLFSPGSSKNEELFRNAKNGQFLFENIPPGRYTLMLRAEEFKDMDITFVVTSGTRELGLIVASYTTFRYLQKLYLVTVTTLIFLAGLTLFLSGSLSSTKNFFLSILGLLIIANNWFFLVYKLAPWPRYSMILFHVIIIIMATMAVRGKIHFLNHLVRPLRFIIPGTQSAVANRLELIGLTGKVVSETLSSHFGLIHVINDRHELTKIFGVLAEGFEPVPRGTEVVIVSYDPSRRVYIVMAEEALRT